MFDCPWRKGTPPLATPWPVGRLAATAPASCLAIGRIEFDKADGRRQQLKRSLKNRIREDRVSELAQIVREFPDRRISGRSRLFQLELANLVVGGPPLGGEATQTENKISSVLGVALHGDSYPQTLASSFPLGG
jgi:hypothetical protein